MKTTDKRTNATATPEPVTALDFSEVESTLFDAREMAKILHRMLDQLERLPVEICKGAPNLLAFDENERNLFCFAAWKTVRAIEEAEKELDAQLYPPAEQAA